MKVAILNEFLTQYGGGERVLEAFLRVWPEAPIYTLYYDKDKMGKYFGQYDVRSSFLQRAPTFLPAGYKSLLPLMPTAIEQFDFSDYDLVISNTSAYTKGAKTKHPTVHVCYLLTPTRYLWSDTKDYLRDAPVPGYLRPILPPFWTYLRWWDYRAARRPDMMIADSETTAARSRKYYDRDPEHVLFPPVELANFSISPKIGDYWLVVARQEPYKRSDLAIAAATKLGVKLKVVGGGTKLDRLHQLAGPTVEFMGRVSDEELAELYRNAIGLIFPQLEDAGITPLESMASGRPVLAFGQGGALETVVPGVTGEFFAEQTIDSLANAMRQFKSNAYNPEKIRAHAASYDTAIFLEKFRSMVDEAVTKVQVH